VHNEFGCAGCPITKRADTSPFHASRPAPRCWPDRWDRRTGATSGKRRAGDPGTACSPWPRGYWASGIYPQFLWITVWIPRPIATPDGIPAGLLTDCSLFAQILFILFYQKLRRDLSSILSVCRARFPSTSSTLLNVHKMTHAITERRRMQGPAELSHARSEHAIDTKNGGAPKDRPRHLFPRREYPDYRVLTPATSCWATFWPSP